MATKARFGHVSTVVVAVSLFLALPAPVGVRADNTLGPQDQQAVDRVTVGLVARGLPIVSVLSFSVALEDCYVHFRQGGTLGNFQTCLQKAAEDNNIPYDSLLDASGPSGGWSVTFGMCNPKCGNYKTGKVTVGPRHNGSETGVEYGASLTYTAGGSSNLTLRPDALGNYEFTYHNSFGQSGTGSLYWSTNPCYLYGAYFDDKDPQNAGIILFHRC